MLKDVNKFENVDAFVCVFSHRNARELKLAQIKPGRIHNQNDVSRPRIIGISATRKPTVECVACHRDVFVGTHDIHALILGRAITGLQAFSAER